MSPLDRTDLFILSALEKDGRISMSELAQRLHISRSAAYERVQRLRASGVITGFSVRLDAARLGLGLAAFITITTEQAAWDTISEQLRRMPEIEYAAATAGNFDALVLVRVGTLEELKELVLDRVHTLVGVKATTTIIVLDEIIKRTSALPPILDGGPTL